MTRATLLSGVFLILGVDTVVAGFLAPAAGVPSDAERAAAMADARSRLESAIADLSLGNQRFVRDLLDESTLSNDLSRLTRDARPLGPARKYRDGVTETHLTLDVAGLTARLKELLRDRGVSDDIATAQLEGIDPRAAEMRLTVAGLVGPDSGSGDVPPGWKTLGPAAVELAAEAARLDAQIKLVEKIGEIVQVGDRRLSAYFAVEPESRAKVLHRLPDSIFDRPRFTIERRCMIRASMDAGAVLERMDFGVIVGENAGPKEITLTKGAPARVSAIGTGLVPSAPVMKRMGLKAPDQRPRWADQCLIVTGRAAIPRVIANRSSPLAASLNAAETDAKRRMEMRIASLPVRPGVTVGDVCGTDEPSLDSEPDIQRTVAEFLAGAHRVNRDATIEGGSVQVRLSLPLTRLWHIVREQPVFADSGDGSP